MAWYYKDGDQEIGPLEKQQLQELVNSKRIDKQTLVRSSAIKEWKPLAEVANKKEEATISRPAPVENSPKTESTTEPSGNAPGPSSESVVCSQCGNSFPKDQVLTFDDRTVCAGCKPGFVQKLKEGATFDGSFRYAGFWIRFGAKVIDLILIYVVNTALIMLMAVLLGGSALSINPEDGTVPKGFWLMLGIQQLIGIGIPTFYNTFFIGRFGATLGKMACGLKVITPSGDRVSYPRALGRNFAEWISGIILCIGYIMVAFDSEKRSLHDHICSTRVTYKK